MYVYIFADAVDNGHNKKAIQIADKVLKKQTDLHCAKVKKQIGTGEGCPKRLSEGEDPLVKTLPHICGSL